MTDETANTREPEGAWATSPRPPPSRAGRTITGDEAAALLSHFTRTRTHRVWRWQRTDRPDYETALVVLVFVWGMDLVGFWREGLSAFVLRGLVVCVLATAVFVALYLRRVTEER